MAKLILSMDGLVLKEIPLVKERTTIGRKPHNDIQIDNLAVSGEHAVIVTILNDSFLEDLGSTNGTLVNGNAVKKHFLQNNDIVELGKYKLKYLAEPGQQPAATAADFEKTMVLRPSAMKAAQDQARAMAGGNAQPQPQAAEAVRASAAQHAAASATSTGTADRTSPAPASALHAAAPAAAGAHSASAPSPQPVPPAAAAPAAAAVAAKSAQILGAIQILSGGNAGKELELAKPLTTLGKPGVQVAVLTRRPQGYFLTHVEGAKQPTVNGQSIGAAPHMLKDHDVIEIAGVKMEYFVKS
ncbi:MAG TPA: FHA domain-containing protein [Burkholderiales bacterium]|nr:FHA domain-containing protein [Burkholderiales bacterium]